MAHLTEGGPARIVPLTYYDKDGNRYVVGKAKARLINGQVTVEAELSNEKDGAYSHEFDIDHFDFEPIVPK